MRFEVFVVRALNFLTNIFLLSGCLYGAGDASVYFGTEVDPNFELASINGIFSASTSSKFTAEDPSAAESGVGGGGSASAGSASFTVRFVNDDYRKFASCLVGISHVEGWRS